MTARLKIAVAITDGSWHKHLTGLHERSALEEVNFWQPSAQGFSALSQGELLLFRVRDQTTGSGLIAGGGVFTHYIRLPLSIAWDAFGECNGTASLDSLRRAISRYRREDPESREDYLVGCRVLVEPIFLPRDNWFQPPGWGEGRNAPSNPVKKYFADEQEGKRLWEMWATACHDAAPDQPRRFGKPQLIVPRLGQGAFRTGIVNVYQRCAVTRDSTLLVLDAAHIRPYSQRGAHEITNGLLLRKDLHTLFDSGYISVAAEKNRHRLQVSHRLEEDTGNGRNYRAMHGQDLLLPRSRKHHPNPEHLQWHNETVYRG